VFTLTSARTLFKTVNKANTIREAKVEISDVIWDALNEIWKNYQVPGSGEDLASLELPKLSARCRNANDTLLRLLYIMEHHLDGNYGEFTVIAAGVVFFFVALFIFMITTQRVVMWVPTVVLVTLMTVCLLLKELHHNPDIWKEMPFISARRKQRYMGKYLPKGDHGSHL
jgi:hypothetical protein